MVNEFLCAGTPGQSSVQNEQIDPLSPTAAEMRRHWQVLLKTAVLAGSATLLGIGAVLAAIAGLCWAIGLI